MPKFPNMKEPDEPKHEIRAPNVNHNEPAKVSSQAVLMENFGLPAEPIAGVQFTTSTFTRFSDEAPKLHVLTVSSTNKVMYMQRSPLTLGWDTTELRYPGAASDCSDIACSPYGNRVTFFMIFTNIVYRIQSYYDEVADRQSFYGQEWVNIGLIPPTTTSPTAVKLSVSGLHIYASYDCGGSDSGIFTKNWTDNSGSNFQKYDKSGNCKHVYDIVAVPGGVYGATASESGGTGLIQYYKVGDLNADPVTVTKSSNNKFYQLQVSLDPTRGVNDHAVYAKDNVKRVWFYRVIQEVSSAKQLPTEKSIDNFTVVAQPGSDRESIFFVATDNTLFMNTNHVDEFGKEIQLGTDAATVMGASYIGTEYNNHADVFYVTTRDSQLVEMKPTSIDSFEREVMSQNPPVPVSSSQPTNITTSAWHQGLPNVFYTDKDNSHIRRLVKCLEKDITDEYWEMEDWNQDGVKDKTVVCLESTTHNDNAVLFMVDSQSGVWGLDLGTVEKWVFYGTMPGSNPRPIIRPGVIDDELVLLVIVTNGGPPGVYQVDLHNDSFSHWQLLPASSLYDTINDISIGATTQGDGYFIAGFNQEGTTASASFCRLQSESPVQTFGSITDGSSYQRVFGTSKKTDEVFLIADNIQLYYCKSPTGKGNLITYANNMSYYYPPDNNDGDVIRVVYPYSTSGVIRTITVTGGQPGAYQQMTNTFRNGDLVALDELFTFGIKSNGSLAQILYIKQTGHWVTSEIKYKTHTYIPPIAFKSWVVDYTTTDANGFPAPFTPVHIQPVEDDVTLLLNGKIVVRGSDDPPLDTTTNGRGVANITMFAKSLHAPVLRIWTDYLPADSTSVVEPNGEEMIIFANITQPELEDATKHDGSPLFGPDQDKPDASFVAALNETAAMAMTSNDDYENPSALLSRGNKSTIHRVTPRDEAHRCRGLNSKKCKSSNVHIRYLTDAATGKRSIKFVKGSREEVLAAHAEREAELFASTTATEFVGTFGQCMESCKQGFSDLDSVSYVTPTASEVQSYGAQLGGFWFGVTTFIKVAVIFYIRNTPYIWNGLVAFAEDLMSIAESMFNHLKVKFNDLFDWLASFFSWEDILQNQRALAKLMTYTLDKLPGTVEYVASIFRVAPSMLPNSLSDGDRVALDKSISDEAAVGNEETAANGYKGKSGLDDEGTVFGSDPHTNWFSNLFDAYLGQSTGIPELMQKAAEMLASLEAIAETMNKMTVTLTAGGVDELFKVMQKIIDKGTDITLRDIGAYAEGVLRGFLNTSLNEFGNLLDNLSQVFSSMTDLMNTPVNIPIITNLFKEATRLDGDQQELTLLNLITVLMAVPMTQAVKLMCAVAGKPYTPLTVEYGSGRMIDVSYGYKESYGFGIAYAVCYGMLGCVDSYQVFQESKGPKGNYTPSYTTFLKTFFNLSAQIVSCPHFAIGFPSPDDVTHREAAEITSWWWQLTFIAVDLNDVRALFRGNLIEGGDETKIQDYLTSGMVTSVCGVVHMALFIWLAIEDSQYTPPEFKSSCKEQCKNGSESDRAACEAKCVKEFMDKYHVSQSLKIAQNISTAFGEVLGFPRESWLPYVPHKAVLAGLTALYQIIAHFGPSGLSAGRTHVDFELAVMHVVAN